MDVDRIRRCEIIRNQYLNNFSAKLTGQVCYSGVENACLSNQLKVGEVWNKSGHLNGIIFENLITIGVENLPALPSHFRQDDERLSCLEAGVEAGTCCKSVEGSSDGAYLGRLDV